MSRRPSFRRAHVDQGADAVRLSRQPRRRSRSRRSKDRHPLRTAASKELRRRRPPAEGPKISRKDDIF